MSVNSVDYPAPPGDQQLVATGRAGRADGAAVHDPWASGRPGLSGYTLRDLGLALRKYRSTIATVLGVVLIVTLATASLMRPVYQSTVHVAATQSQTDDFSETPAAEQQSSGDRTFFKSQVSVIKSHGVARAVIETLNLGDDPELNGTLRQRGIVTGFREVWGAVQDKLRNGGNADQMAGSIASQNEAFAIAQEHLRIRNFVDRIDVRQTKESNLIAISFDSFDAQKSTDIANALAHASVSLSDELNLDTSSSAKVFLQGEIAAARTQVERTKRALAEFTRGRQLTEEVGNSNIRTAGLDELSAALVALKTMRIAAQAEFKQAKIDAMDTGPMLLSQPSIHRLKQQLSTLTDEYRHLSSIYKRNYPPLRELSKQIAALDTIIADTFTKVIDSYESGYAKLLEEERLVSTRLEEEKALLMGRNDRVISHQILEQELESSKALYDGLIERATEFGQGAGIALNNLSVVEGAALPAKAYKPVMAWKILLGMLVGLVLGIGFALLFAFLDNTITSTEELERVAPIASLGVVPRVDTESLPEEYSLDLISHQSPDSRISEAYRSVRSSLVAASSIGAPQMLLVTSSIHSEGKSVSAINLALALAQNDAKVLLVDADLRKSRMHRVFHVPTSPGLSEYLTLQRPPNVIRRTELPTLHILTAGLRPHNPAGLLGSAKMETFLASVRDRYDHIVFDAPPILGYADSVILATRVDGVLMVVSANEVKKDAVRESVKRLRMVHAPLLGAALNGVNFGRYGYEEFADDDEDFDNYPLEEDVEQRV